MDLLRILTIVYLLTGKNDGSLGYISAASWTSCGSAQNVFRGFGITTGKFIEDAIKVISGQSQH
jgi:hypothetical protein